METCFVIQPFDKGKFDDRYKDTFEPAILKAGLQPYRVDRDMGVRIPIDDIEKGILESALCFAEITLDNPNVWYELGFAFACDKDVVMVCTEERVGFPFDIQHRSIIRYKTGSKSDFETLEKNITDRINALQQKTKTARTLSASPVKETEGLKSHEIAILIFLMEYEVGNQHALAIYSLKHSMNDAGYTDIATSIGVKSLEKGGMIETFNTSDGWNEEYIGCKLTDAGESWILQNQGQLEFRKPTVKKSAVGAASPEDDLPF